jgi:hypothetical protein
LFLLLLLYACLHRPRVETAAPSLPLRHLEGQLLRIFCRYVIFDVLVQVVVYDGRGWREALFLWLVQMLRREFIIIHAESALNQGACDGSLLHEVVVGSLGEDKLLEIRG